MMRGLAIIGAVLAALISIFPAKAQDDGSAKPPVAMTPPETPAALAEFRQSVDPVRLELAEQILDVGLPPERREAVFMSTADGIIEQMENSVPSDIDDPEVLAIIEDHRSEMIGRMKAVMLAYLPNIMEGWAIALAMEFSEEELRDILAFVSTPSGQRYFESSSTIISNPAFAAANEAYMRAIFRMIPQEQRRLQNRLRDHFESQG